MSDDRRFSLGALLFITGFLTYTTSSIYWLIESSPYVSTQVMYAWPFGLSFMAEMLQLCLVMIVLGTYLLIRCILDSRKAA